MSDPLIVAVAIGILGLVLLGTLIVGLHSFFYASLIGAMAVVALLLGRSDPPA